MAERTYYSLQKPARMLQGNVTKKSAPRGSDNAKETYYGVWGLEKKDFDALIKIQVEAIKAEMGKFTNPDEYQLCCISGEKAAQKELKKAEYTADQLENQGKSDEALKVRESAETKATLYRQYAGILRAASKFDVALSKLAGGKIIDIPAEEHAKAQAGKDLFYSGSFQVVNIGVQAYRRKQIDGKDGATAYLNNVLFVRNGEKIGGGASSSNSSVFGGFAAAYSEVDPTALATSNEDVAEQHDF